MQKKYLLIIGLSFLLGISWGVYELKYYFSYRADLNSRPWAYSEDPPEKLLVGHWQGSFVDPNGLAKTLTLEIKLPVTEAERERSGRLRGIRQCQQE